MLDTGAAPAKTTLGPAAKKARKATKKKATKKRARKAAKKVAKKVAKQRPAKKKSANRTDWNAVLAGLPESFTAMQVKEAAGNRSNDADVHQALLRWRRAGSVTTTGRGQYQKA